MDHISQTCFSQFNGLQCNFHCIKCMQLLNCPILARPADNISFHILAKEPIFIEHEATKKGKIFP